MSPPPLSDLAAVLLAAHREPAAALPGWLSPAAVAGYTARQVWAAYRELETAGLIEPAPRIRLGDRRTLPDYRLPGPPPDEPHRRGPG